MDHISSHSAYSRFASEKEIKSSLHGVNIKDNESLYGGIPLYSESTSDSTTVYVEREDSHTLIIGSTGSKKTRLIGMPSLYLYALAGESFIATDPKAELFEKTMPMLKKHDYNIFVLNLRDPLQSNSWNPLIMPYRLYKTGFRDKAIELVIDMSNSIANKDPSHDPYWTNSASNLLAGLILTLFECAGEKEINFKSLRTLRTQAFMSQEDDDNCFLLEKFLKNIDRSSYIFSMLSGTSEVTDSTQSCIISVFDQTLQPFFSQDNLIDMLSGADIDMENFGKEKTAVFLIIPDENTIYHSLISVFVKQCYTRLIHSAQKQPLKMLSKRVNFLLDEFSSLPQIKDFPAMMTASRSRNIRFNLIIQSISQLAKRYGNEAETIKGNCENWVFLHSREVSLLNEIIDLCGKKNSEDLLISAIRLQTMDKEKGEAFFLIKRQYPYIGTLPDIKQYPEILFDNKEAEYPVNNSKVLSVFDFEAFCDYELPENHSKLFSSNNKIFKDADTIKETEIIFTSSIEEEEQKKNRNINIKEFLTGLSGLTKKYGFVVHGCKHCTGPRLYDTKFMRLYEHLEYNNDTESYKTDDSGTELKNNGGQTNE